MASAPRRTKQAVTVPAAPELPASEEAIVAQVRNMLTQIDQEKARCYVQRLANDHKESDIFDDRQGGQPVTYAERLEFLDESERKLRAALPKAVTERLE